jgi:hypothetical protein
MAVYLHKKNTSGQRLVLPSFEPPAQPAQTIGQVFGAAFELESPIKAYYDLATEPSFPVDPEFNNYERTRNSPYWELHRNSFLGAQSEEHWNFIAAKIERENKARERLEAAGAGGMLAAMVAGVLSPSMLIPGTVPLRGMRGIAAAAGLGALAAGVDEVALQAAQETRTEEESAFAIVAGTLFGGVLGGAASLLKVHPTDEIGQIFADIRERYRSDMAVPADGEYGRTLGEGSVIYRELQPGTIRADDIAGQSQAPIARTVYRAETTAPEEGRVVWFDQPDEAANITVREDVQFERLLTADNWNEIKKELGLARNAPRERVLDEARTQGYDGLEYRTSKKDPLRIDQIVQPTNRVVQEGPLIRTPSASATVTDVVDAVPVAPRQGGAAGAQSAQSSSPGGLKAGPGVKTLAQLSPVAQTIAQREFPLAGDTMAQLATAGLRLEGNMKGIPSARGGTVEARVGLYDAFVAKLVRVMDEHYADYIYNGETAAPFPATRAALRSNFRMTGEKMSREEFATEVSRAMFNGDEHVVKQVQSAAKLLRSEVYDPILKEARAVGLFDEGDLFDDASYLARMYDTAKIDADPNGFAAKLAAHFEKLLQDEVAGASDRLKAQRALFDEYVDDVSADATEGARRREEFKARLDELGELDEETEIRILKTERKELAKQVKAYSIRTPEDLTGRATLSQRLEEIKAQIKAKEQSIAEQLHEKRTLRRRLRNLNRARFAIEEKRAAKLERIERVESDALGALTATLKKGMELQRNLGKLSRTELGRQERILANRLERTMDSLDKRMNHLEKLSAEGDMEGFTKYLLDNDDTIDRARIRIADLQDRLTDIDDLVANREVLADILGDIAVEATAEINHLNLIRGRRIAKLDENLKKLDPAKADEYIEAARKRMAEREGRTYERLREAGIDDFDLETGNAVVKQVAYDRAIKARDTVQKLNNRVSGLHIIGEERGSELARVLSIPSNEILDYLITDIERVTRNYVRQVAADVELKRSFGDVDLKERFKELNEEYDRVARQMEADGASPDEMARMSRRYRQHIRNLTASISRLRHTWGIPDNPDGFAARAGKVMLDLSTLRFMGSVAISSIPDMGRLVMKHGLRRTFGTAFKSLVSDFKTWNLSAREIKLAGGALDPVIHSRAMAFADLLDEYVGNTIPEKAIHTMSTKIGQIAGFDYWTSFMKQMSGVLDTAKVMDSIDLVINGNGKAADIDEAVEYLAANGLDADLARRIWDQVQEGGGQKVNGIWLPNTEDWTDQELVRTFRAALRQENNNTIVTPGLEVPLITNASIANRLLFQFKSFALASHSKTVMAGLQQRDMALVNGMGISLALGAFSYYTWAISVGGEAYDSMMNAGWEKWLDEAISRGGFTGAFSEVQRIAERIPLTAPYANFSGERSTRRAGSDLTEALLGPSFDTLGTAAGVLAGIDDPTKSTVHQLRTLMPLQNVFYLRQLFTLLEQSAAENLPERRDQ